MSAGTGRYWDRWASEYVANGELSWRLGPGDEVGSGTSPSASPTLPDDLAGRDTIELGWGPPTCRPGSPVVAPDRWASTTPGAARDARRLHRAQAEIPADPRQRRSRPFPDASFDVAISEYGASIWADPFAWVPEANRLLRPGGRLIFLINATLLMLCMPDEERAATNELVRPLRGLHRFEWSEDESVNFALSHGLWIGCSSERFRDRGARRAVAGRGRDIGLPVRDGRVGGPVADRGGLDRPEAGLTGNRERHPTRIHRANDLEPRLRYPEPP
jgi:SAM-dependent methyltransferase